MLFSFSLASFDFLPPFFTDGLIVQECTVEELEIQFRGRVEYFCCVDKGLGFILCFVKKTKVQFSCVCRFSLTIIFYGVFTII